MSVKIKPKRQQEKGKTFLIRNPQTLNDFVSIPLKREHLSLIRLRNTPLFDKRNEFLTYFANAR